MIIDEIEHLATRLNALREAEDLALKVHSRTLPDLRRLYGETLESMISLVSKVLRHRIQLGGKPSEPRLEYLERLFLVLRDQAEIEWRRSLKLAQKEAKLARLAREKADQLALLAHQAAVELKNAAERAGVWNDAYRKEHGVDVWL